MTEETLPTITRQSIEVEGRSQRNRVTGKLRVALDLMVWQGLKRADAAEKAGLKDHSLCTALRKGHVLGYYNGELTSLRNSLRSRNLHRLDGIADDSKNDMARVASIKALEQIADNADAVVRHPGGQQVPGLVIVVNTGGSTPAKIIGPGPAPQIEGEAAAGRA